MNKKSYLHHAPALLLLLIIITATSLVFYRNESNSQFLIDHVMTQSNSLELIKTIELAKQQEGTIILCIGIITVILIIITGIIHSRNLRKLFTSKLTEADFRQKELQKLIEERSKELLENKEQFDCIYQNSQSCMLIIDPANGRIVNANKAAIKFYGYTYEQLCSIRITDINILSKGEVRKAMNDVQKCKSGHHFFKHKLASGIIKDVEVYSDEIIFDKRKLLYSIVHDISELRKTQKELIIAKNKAEESDRLKSAFLANMSHEIRTPMNSILGFTDLLNNPHNTKEQKDKYYTIINKSSKQLLHIIDDIIDISRIESNLIQTHLKNISVNKTLKYITESFKQTHATHKEEIELLLNIPTHDVLLATDEYRFIQICNNLLSNAYKNTEKGTIKIGYEVQDNTAQFYVKDTGCGIPNDKFDLIFDRFSQLTKEDYRKGNGLGLSITKGLVQLLGGNIKLKSQVNKGTTFYFSLPLQNKKSCKPQVNIA